MSMSEFERCQDQSQFEPSQPPTEEALCPADFLLEDKVFAEELHLLFNLEDGEVPPHFVQTLLAAEEPLFRPLEDGFEQRVRAHVFHKLQIKHRLFPKVKPIKHHSLGIPGLMIFLFMIVSMIYTTPAFVSGLLFLVSGSYDNVAQIASVPWRLYPDTVKIGPPLVQREEDPPIHFTLSQAQQMLHFPIYWPNLDDLPRHYFLKNIYLYDRFDQNWVDGSFLQMEYAYMPSGTLPRAYEQTHKIVICQFKPLDDTVQFVKLDTDEILKIEHGVGWIEVDGKWKSINESYEWSKDGNKLVYELDGVIFWIVGTPGIDLDRQFLQPIAHSMHKIDPSIVHGSSLDAVAQSLSMAPESARKEVIYLDNPNDPRGPALKVVSVPEMRSLALRLYRNPPIV